MSYEADALRKQHLEEAKRPFIWKCAVTSFSAVERRFMSRWGSWMLALWSGRLRPYTSEQAEFISATRGQKPRQTFAEILCSRYLALAGLQDYLQPESPAPDSYFARNAPAVQTDMERGEPYRTIEETEDGLPFVEERDPFEGSPFTYDDFLDESAYLDGRCDEPWDDIDAEDTDDADEEDIEDGDDLGDDILDDERD